MKHQFQRQVPPTPQPQGPRDPIRRFIAIAFPVLAIVLLVGMLKGIDISPLAPWIAIAIALVVLWTSREMLSIARRREQKELLSEKQTSAEEERE